MDLFRKKLWYYDKDRRRLSMIWVPPLGFDPYCGCYPYKINLPQVSNRKIIFYKSYEEILKNQKSNFLKNGSTDLDG